MAYDSLREYLRALEQRRLLRHVTAEVDPVHELGAIAHLSLRDKGPALLFENIKGYATPLVTNVLSTDDSVAVAFGVTDDPLADTVGTSRMHRLFQVILDGMQHPIGLEEVATGACKEEVYLGDDVDLEKFPTPVWHEQDAGPYFGTFHGCFTTHRDTGDINVGMYRMMVRDRQSLSLSMHRDGLGHFRTWEKKGEPMPMVVAVGMDPLLSIAAMSTISSGIAPHAEIAVAGGWRGRPVSMTRAETLAMLVPADAEIVLEGHVTPGVRVVDGPHGESHGFYGTEESALEYKVTAITHRTRPIHQGLICNFMEDGGKRITRSALMWGALKRVGIPGIVDVRFPDPGCGQEICVIAADITMQGQVHRIVSAVQAVTATVTPWTIVVDPDANLDDWNDIWWRLYTRVMPDRDIWITPRRTRGGHHPQAKHDHFSRVGIDATSKFKDVEFPTVNAVSPELTRRVRARWQELGLT